MSAYLDSLSGAGYDGSEDGGIGDVGSSDYPMTTAATAASGGNGGYFSGLLQSASALGTGYIAKRLDIDLYQRAAGAQAYPTLGTTQNGVLIRNAGVPMPGGVAQVQGGGQTLLNLNALLPYLLVGAAVFFIAKGRLMAGANPIQAAAAANPFTSFLGNMGSGLGKGLGDAIGGGGGPLVSGSNQDARSFMDGSGWTVSTGGSTATGGKSGGASGGTSSGAATPHPGYSVAAQQAGSPWLMLAIAGGALWMYLKR